MSKTEFLYKKTTKYLAQLISDHIGDPEYRLPTELSVAERQGVSRITVRKAFKELDNLQLLKRIKGNGTYISEKATKESLAPFLKEIKASETKKVALILPQLDGSQHIMDILSSIMQEAPDLHVLVAISDMSVEREQELIDEYLRLGVDGIILYPIDNDIYNPALFSLATSDFPLIMIDRYLPGLNFAHVASDHYGMVTEAVTYLTSRRHEHILYFNSNTKTNTALIARQESYIQTLNDLNNYNQYFFIFCGDLDPTSQMFAKNFREYLDCHPQITAILTADYASSVHLIQIFKLLGLSLSQDYKVVLLDFTAPKDHFNPETKLPPLIQQDARKLGAEAVRLLRLAFEGTPIQSHKITLPATMVNIDEIE